jgi:hypothetical protein
MSFADSQWSEHWEDTSIHSDLFLNLLDSATEKAEACRSHNLDVEEESTDPNDGTALWQDEVSPAVWVNDFELEADDGSQAILTLTNLYLTGMSGVPSRWRPFDRLPLVFRYWPMLSAVDSKIVELISEYDVYWIDEPGLGWASMGASSIREIFATNTVQGWRWDDDDDIWKPYSARWTRSLPRLSWTSIQVYVNSVGSNTLGMGHSLITFPTRTFTTSVTETLEGHALTPPQYNVYEAEETRDEVHYVDHYGIITPQDWPFIFSKEYLTDTTVTLAVAHTKMYGWASGMHYYETNIQISGWSTGIVDGGGVQLNGSYYFDGIVEVDPPAWSFSEDPIAVAKFSPTNGSWVLYGTDMNKASGFFSSYDPFFRPQWLAWYIVSGDTEISTTGYRDTLGLSWYLGDTVIDSNVSPEEFWPTGDFNYRGTGIVREVAWEMKDTGERVQGVWRPYNAFYLFRLEDQSKFRSFVLAYNSHTGAVEESEAFPFSFPLGGYAWGEPNVDHAPPKHFWVWPDGHEPATDAFQWDAGVGLKTAFRTGLTTIESPDDDVVDIDAFIDVNMFTNQADTWSWSVTVNTPEDRYMVFTNDAWLSVNKPHDVGYRIEVKTVIPAGAVRYVRMGSNPGFVTKKQLWARRAILECFGRQQFRDDDNYNERFFYDVQEDQYGVNENFGIGEDDDITASFVLTNSIEHISQSIDPTYFAYRNEWASEYSGWTHDSFWCGDFQEFHRCSGSGRRARWEHLLLLAYEKPVVVSWFLDTQGYAGRQDGDVRAVQNQPYTNWVMMAMDPDVSVPDWAGDSQGFVHQETVTVEPEVLEVDFYGASDWVSSALTFVRGLYYDEDDAVLETETRPHISDDQYTWYGSAGSAYWFWNYPYTGLTPGRFPYSLDTIMDQSSYGPECNQRYVQSMWGGATFSAPKPRALAVVDFQFDYTHEEGE